MNIPLTREWSLWPEFAVRSAGFPVAGLDAFGPDEEARLADVARTPRFREAVAWQSREALRSAVEKLDEPGSEARRRRRLEVVGSYWQRYCGKNDTIGFFGPLAWGSFSASASAVRSGGLVRERVVHFETWAMEAVAAAAGSPTALPMCPDPESHLDPGTPGLERLLAARRLVCEAADVAQALDELDRVFEGVTGRPAVRADGESGGGRTIAYLDCMRDLDVTVGPAITDELRRSLPRVLDASRWWCGRVFARGAERLERLAQDGPLAPQLGPLLGAGFALWDQVGDEQAELRRRWATGDYGDWAPAWHGSCHHSADIQIAATDLDADDALLVLGDFHGGGNPLAQGLFGLRHPDPPGLLRRLAAEAGPGVHLSPPRRGAVEMTARSWPLYPEGDVVVVARGEPAPPGTRTVALEDVVVRDGHATDRRGTFTVPIAELLFLPIFVAALRSFDPIGPQEGRAQVGRLVLRRATWTVAADGLPDDLRGWARERGLPRRVFVRSPLERKPRYVDFGSPTLVRALDRFLAPARERGGPVEVVEMLPAPEQCWLASDEGRHTSELRIVATSAA